MICFAVDLKNADSSFHMRSWHDDSHAAVQSSSIGSTDGIFQRKSHGGQRNDKISVDAMQAD